MKKQYLWLEFGAVFVFLILPPLFTNPGTTAVVSYAFQPLLFAQMAIAVLLDVQYHKEIILDNTTGNKPKYFVYLSVGAITMGLLMLIFALLQGLALLFPSISTNQLLSDTIAPTGVKQWIVCLLTLIISAFYEESIYRQCLPNCVHLFTVTGKKKAYLTILIECLCILIFALSHRYLGWIAVLNAFLCGCILRFCCKKTGSIYTGAIVHFIYNAMMYVFLSL